MKYSVLLLGASISISFFIRICCATNALYELGNGDSKKKLDAKKFEFGLEFESALDKVADIRRDEKRDYEVCGISDPPNLHLPHCEDYNCTKSGDELPDACEYNELSRILTCSDAALKQMPAIPVNLATDLRLLDLSDTNIEEVPVLAFRNISVEEIWIINNAISYINPYAFHGVKNLQTLKISQNKLDYLSYEIYVGLNDTEVLDLSYNSINLEVYVDCPLIDPIDSMPTVLPQLKTMNLTGNPLIIVPQYMFVGLRHSPLRSLYLDNCYLQRIHPNAFQFTTQLLILGLSGNKGSVVTSHLADFIYPLVNLERLYLKDTGLSNFSQLHSALSLLPKLRQLDLNYNQFVTITADDMSKLPNIEELNLDNCGILSIDNDAFSSNTKLTSLTLQNNRISQLPTLFPPSLKKLSLSSHDPTFFSSCKVDSFQHLPNLSELELEGVQLETINSSTFKGLTSVAKIFLDRCNIHSIEEGTFSNLPKVTTISLKRNSISHIAPGSFKGLEALQRINLIESNLVFNEGGAFISNRYAFYDKNAAPPQSPFTNLPNLKFLNLSNNKMKTLPDNLFNLKDLPKLRDLDLSENSIETWELPLLNDRNFTVYDLDERGEIYVFILSLRHTNVQFLTEAMLDDFIRMTTIDLSNNRFICDQGACKLREMIENALVSRKQDWINYEDYNCFDIKSNSKSIPIMNVTEEICIQNSADSQSPKPEEEDRDDNKDPIGLSESSSTTTIITIAASVSLIAVVVILLAYKNRVHLRYFLFAAKFNIMPATPRKAKLSTMESDSVTDYEYDVFISYHNEDTKFIAEVFLPEIEVQKSEWDRPTSEIYTIENDDMSIISQSSDNDPKHQQKQNDKKFKVCLHERDFAAGVPITDNIVDCVDRSRKTIIFVSKKYMDSQWCSFEMNLVYHRLVESRRKAFVLVLLEDIPSESRSKVLKYLMITKTYLQWPGMNGSALDKTSFWKRLRAFLQSVD